jgi:predicted alpha/beta superfamily hydrolase
VRRRRLSWDRPLLAAPGEAPGRYRLRVTLADDATGGQPLAYKFRIERGEHQPPDEGWEPGRNHALTLLPGGAQRVERAFGVAAGAAAVAGRHVERLGEVESVHVGRRAVQVGHRRRGHPRDPLPVLYLHDGQNLFDAAAAGAEWQVDEAAERGVASGRLRPFIVVAVDNTAARVTDYTPTAMDAGRRPRGSPHGRQGGGAAAYARLIEELKPRIDAGYRTRPARPTPRWVARRWAAWCRLAGLHHPQVFGAALVVSPSVWWDDRFLLRDLAAWRAARAAPTAVAGHGRARRRTGAAARRELAAARARGWTDASLRYAEFPDASHDEASWARRVPARTSCTARLSSGPRRRRPAGTHRRTRPRRRGAACRAGRAALALDAARLGQRRLDLAARCATKAWSCTTTLASRLTSSDSGSMLDEPTVAQRPSTTATLACRKAGVYS